MNCHNERLQQGSKIFSHTASPPVAEALAIRTVLLHVLEVGFSKICVKSDCQAFVAAITSKYHPMDLYGINQDIEHLSLSFDCISFSFISRNLNVVADSLVKSVLYLATSQLVSVGLLLLLNISIGVKKKRLPLLHTGLDLRMGCQLGG